MESEVFPAELSESDAPRVRWLCRASRDAIDSLCDDACESDPAEVHAARFVLHIMAQAALPSGYAWSVLNSPEYILGRNAYSAPVEGHICTLAMYAADLDDVDADLAAFCSRRNPELEQAAAFRFAGSPKALNDDRLLELSFSANDDLRRVVARILEFRESPCRNEILTRLMDDSVRGVSIAASCVAGRIGDPELADRLAAKGNLFSLSFAGDPRARPRVEALVNSDDPLSGEEAVATAIALGDRDLLSKLWCHPEWDTRANAIIGSVAEGYLDNVRLEDIFSRLSKEQLVELAMRWPATHTEGLTKLANLLCEPAGPLPEYDLLQAGGPKAVKRLRTWITSAPIKCGAAVRFLPTDSAVSLATELIASPNSETRAVAARTIAHLSLEACYPLVAELCVDPVEEVATAATAALRWGRIRCGVFGLDSAVLRTGRDYPGSSYARRALSHLVEDILSK